MIEDKVIALELKKEKVTVSDKEVEAELAKLKMPAEMKHLTKR